MASRPQLPELDYEAMTRAGDPRHVARGVPRSRLARVLVPEGGVRAARHAVRARAEGARLRARHARALPRDLRRLARGRAALRHEGRGLRGAVARPAGRSARRRAVGDATRRSAARSARSSRSTARSPDLDCWITGLRRDQSPTRADAPKVGWDERHELWKANPLADWDDARLLGLHPRARACPTTSSTTVATRRSAARTAPMPGAGREGRWAGLDKTECGLHVAGRREP